MARECLIARRIHVMWGHEIGLAEGFVCLETSVPDNIAVFVEALRSVAKMTSDRNITERVKG